MSHHLPPPVDADGDRRPAERQPAGRVVVNHAPPIPENPSGDASSLFGRPGERGGMIIPRNPSAYMSRMDQGRAGQVRSFLQGASNAFKGPGDRQLNLDPVNNPNYLRDLMEVQKQLLAAGFKIGRADGLLGPKTADAIQQYMSGHKPAAAVAGGVTPHAPPIPDPRAGVVATAPKVNTASASHLPPPV